MAEPRGAATRRSLGTRVSAYLLRHAQVLVGSLGRIAEHPFSTAMTAAVIGIALALPAALHLLVLNGAAFAGRLDDTIDVSVFLKREVNLDAARRVAERVRARADVADVELRAADDALAAFRARPGFGEAIEALEENPLPHALVVRPADTAPEAIAALAAALRAMPEIELVQDDLLWVRRLDAMLEIVRRAVLLAGVLLGAAVLAVVGNTIRLDIESRREEIVVVKLIGGTDGFVRRPFLYAGIWYGLAGGLLALTVISGALWLLRAPVEALAVLYDSDFRLRGLGFGPGAALPLTGAFLGWAGSWIAAARHLRAVEPT